MQSDHVKTLPLLLAGTLCVLAGMAIAPQHGSNAGPNPEDLQQPLPPGVVRLSLARLHARSLAVHHNELQARDKRLTYVYPPEVYADGVKARAWLKKIPAQEEIAKVEKELTDLAAAIVNEARFAAGVQYDAAEDVTVELAIEGIDEVFVYQGGTLTRNQPQTPNATKSKGKK